MVIWFQMLKVQQASLRKLIGVVPQDTVLFNNDIRLLNCVQSSIVLSFLAIVNLIWLVNVMCCLHLLEITYINCIVEAGSWCQILMRNLNLLRIINQYVFFNLFSKFSNTFWWKISCLILVTNAFCNGCIETISEQPILLNNYYAYLYFFKFL